MPAPLFSSVVISGLLCLACGVFASEADDLTQRKRLIEQKIRLVDSLMRAPAASDSASISPASVIAGKRLLDQAREALAKDQLDAATEALDEALRNASRPSNSTTGDARTLSDSAQRNNYKTLLEQVSAYRASIADMLNHGLVAAKPVLARLDRLQTDAAQFEKTGQFSEGNRKLAEAYKLAVDSIGQLRDGQTVTSVQRFERPADEYQFELKRFQSSEILIDMLMGEGRADGIRRSMVEDHVREGQKLQSIAVKQAAQGDFSGAISQMEQATTRLNYGLQLMGVIMF